MSFWSTLLQRTHRRPGHATDTETRTDLGTVRQFGWMARTRVAAVLGRRPPDSDSESTSITVGSQVDVKLLVYTEISRFRFHSTCHRVSPSRSAGVLMTRLDRDSTPKGIDLEARAPFASARLCGASAPSSLLDFKCKLVTPWGK